MTDNVDQIEELVLRAVEERDRTLDYLLDHVRTTLFDVDLSTLGLLLHRMMTEGRIQGLFRVRDRSIERRTLWYGKEMNEVPKSIEFMGQPFEVTHKDVDVVFGTPATPRYVYISDDMIRRYPRRPETP